MHGVGRILLSGLWKWKGNRLKSNATVFKDAGRIVRLEREKGPGCRRGGVAAHNVRRWRQIADIGLEQKDDILPVGRHSN